MENETTESTIIETPIPPAPTEQAIEDSTVYTGDRFLKKWKPNIFMWLAAIILIAAAGLNLYGAVTTPYYTNTVHSNVSTLGGGSLSVTQQSVVAPSIWNNHGKLAIVFVAVTMIPIVFFAKRTLTN